MEKVFGCVLFLLFIFFVDYSTSANVKPTNSSQDCPTTEQGERCTLGLTKEQPANSCYHIFTCNPQGQSGMYWIRNGPTVGEGAHQFFCELEEERCGLRGLMRVSPASPAHHHWHSTGPTAPRSVDLQSKDVTLSSFQCMGWSTTMSVAEQWGTRLLYQKVSTLVHIGASPLTIST